MTRTKAYTKLIKLTGSTDGEEGLVHQSSPSWVITFVSWNVRDTLRAISQSGTDASLLKIRNQIVVENDCIACSVNVNKSVLTHSVSMTLMETDVNYSTSIAPGDFIFVNMLNWEKDARVVASKARAGRPINGPKDGFKGLFKVQGVRRTMAVDTNAGTLHQIIRINGFAFTEFNNSIYFNHSLLTTNASSDKNKLLFSVNLSSDYAQLINTRSNSTCQDVIRFLIQAFIGVGIGDNHVIDVNGIPVTANTHFYMPALIGQLLNIDNVTAAKDIYNYLFGIQQYTNLSHNNSLASGMNPETKPPNDRFYYTSYGKCEGQVLFKAEYWNQEKAWSIIQQYQNAPINELYTCFRISPTGNVMPTVVYRQTPFTSQLFGETPFKFDALVTRFLNVPRWKISPSLVIGYDLGRDESARINFVQIYAQPPANMGKPPANISAQTASGNYAYDINDVLRSGLRPSVITTTFEDLAAFSKADLGRKWALIVGDAVIGGHLKMNGTLECIGISDPIAVGDNLEFDDVVYHIEEVIHTCNIASTTGVKTFRTTLKLSCGVSVSTSNLAYPEMTHTNAYNERKYNYENGDKHLPGVSEEQDASRPGGPAPTSAEINKADAPFIQPGHKIKPKRRT